LFTRCFTRILFYKVFQTFTGIWRHFSKVTEIWDVSSLIFEMLLNFFQDPGRLDWWVLWKLVRVC
jgi:hypothetical protein